MYDHVTDIHRLVVSWIMISGPTGQFYTCGHAVIILTGAVIMYEYTTDEFLRRQRFVFNFQRRLQGYSSFGGNRQSIRNPEDTYGTGPSIHPAVQVYIRVRVVLVPGAVHVF